MIFRPHQPLGRLLHLLTLRRWSTARRAAAHLPLGQLRAQRYQARQLRAVLQDMCYLADDRLALPQIGSAAIAGPAGTDWAWRPAPWRVPLRPNGWAALADKTAISPDVTLFHDCPLRSTTARQIRNLHPDNPAPYRLRLDHLHFAGAFVSVVIDLPAAAITNLRKTHLVELSAILTAERPVTVSARLNVKHGPNIEQIHRSLTADGRVNTIVFDLVHTGLVDQRAEAIWLDLVIDRPQMNQITLHDVTLCRYPRAEF